MNRGSIERRLAALENAPDSQKKSGTMQPGHRPQHAPRHLEP